MVKQAERLERLPAYLFARIEKKIEEYREKGVDIISLGIGDPDQPTPAHIVRRMQAEVDIPGHHQYPSSVGLKSYRQAVAGYYRRRFGVELDPDREVVSLIGSKEGIAHLSFCYVNPGDINLVPDPGYPVYGIGTILAGGNPYLVPLLAENGFLPRLDQIPSEVARQAKILFLNYPNNPTGAVGSMDLFREVVAFAREYDLLVCHDAAYVDIAYEGYSPPSFLQAEGAKEVGIEMGSLSKPFNMTGWRLGWACGHPQAIETLGRLKSNIDSGVFQAIQRAGEEALSGSQEAVNQICSLYQERRDLVVDGLNQLGWKLEKPRASFYIWAPVPQGYTSSEFAEYVLEQAGVIVTPGNGYGQYGEGFFRISLTVATGRIKEALARLKDNLGPATF